MVLLLLVAAWSASAIAEPPPHAPAHGWRAKHAPYYQGYSGKQWEHDYGVMSGRCNRQIIATIAGGVVGGVIAARIAEGNGAVATIIGAAAGALVGNRIGRALDEADHRCVGHALEIGPAGRPVAWTNESTGVHYELVPGSNRRHNGATCREFTVVAVARTDKSSQHSLACSSQPGVWEIIH